MLQSKAQRVFPPRKNQQFLRYRYFAGIRFNWAVGISVGITSLARTHFFRKRGAGCIKKGAGGLFSPQKGGHCPLFEGKWGSRQNNDSKISLGMGITDRYRPENTESISLSLTPARGRRKQNSQDGDGKTGRRSRRMAWLPTAKSPPLL